MTENSTRTVWRVVALKGDRFACNLDLNTKEDAEWVQKVWKEASPQNTSDLIKVVFGKEAP